MSFLKASWKIEDTFQLALVHLVGFEPHTCPVKADYPS